MNRLIYCATVGSERTIDLSMGIEPYYFSGSQKWFDESPVLIDETRITDFAFLGPRVFVLTASEKSFTPKHYRHLPTVSTDVDELIALAQHHSPVLRVLAGPLTNHLLETQVITDVMLQFWSNMRFSELRVPAYDTDTYKLIRDGEILHCDNNYGLKSVVIHRSRV